MSRDLPPQIARHFAPPLMRGVRQHQMQVDSLAEQLFFTTLRIDTVDLAGNAGSGTGFFFGLKRGDMSFPFVVTNKHVVNNMRSGRLNFLKREGDKPLIGQGFPADLLDWSTAWFGHPDPSIDIAILPFAPLEAQIKQQTGTDLFYRLVSAEMLPSDAQLATLDAIELVTFVGYPNGIWDSKSLLPVARRGTTASPLQVDFEGTPRFLVDASVFGGSSGSPVFILNQGMYTDKGGGTAIGSRLLFVGVVAAVFFRTQLNQIVAVPVPTQTQPMARQQEMIDLGIVFKGKTVVETIEAFLAAKGVT
ncbi:MAG: trypsin-like peptidase domain-containing protein [Pseudomonadales bacterium]|nr:trypsin-like peptidase domain-containing protein [Pseudomonadales bacterium]